MRSLVIPVLGVAQSVLGGLSELAGFLTNREPEKTFINQMGRATSGTVIEVSDKVRTNFQDRAATNSNILRKNLETLGDGAGVLKDLASQTYIGAGLVGAGESLMRSERGFIRQALPNLNFPAILSGQGPVRSILANVY